MCPRMSRRSMVFSTEKHLVRAPADPEGTSGANASASTTTNFLTGLVPPRLRCVATNFADQSSHLDEFVRFEVHPAFRPALEILTT